MSTKKLVWFSDGRRFLGPYDPMEIRAQQFGKQWLKDGDPGRVVYRIEATDEADARRRMRLFQEGNRQRRSQP